MSIWVTDFGDKLEMSETDLTVFVTSILFIYHIVHQQTKNIVTKTFILWPIFWAQKESEFKKDFTTDENMILQYDDYNQLAEAGQQIIALVQAGCKSRRNTANAGKWPHLTPILIRL